MTGAAAHVAVMELSAARARAVAIAATGAVAVFGSVAIQGAHGDLLERPGRRGARHERVHGRVGLAGGLLQPAADRAVRAHAAGRARRACRACARCALYRGGLLDCGRAARVGDRPAARSHAAAAREPDPRRRRCALRDRAGARRAAGWSSRRRWPRNCTCASAQASRCPRPIPDELACGGALDEHRLGAGRDRDERRRLRARVGRTDASAYDVLLAPGVRASRAVREIRRALGAGLGRWRSQTRRAARGRQRTLSRQGLARLTQIATLIMSARSLRWPRRWARCSGSAARAWRS